MTPNLQKSLDLLAFAGLRGLSTGRRFPKHRAEKLLAQGLVELRNGEEGRRYFLTCLGHTRRLLNQTKDEIDAAKISLEEIWGFGRDCMNTLVVSRDGHVSGSVREWATKICRRPS